MKITHAEQSSQASNAIRGGAREFKTLLRGEDGTPGNYKLSFVRQSGSLDIPRHKHNFDQLRMCLEGEPQNYGKGKWIKPGEIVYFPEGTPYGPEQSESHRLSITLQFGGASGSGYLGNEAIARAMEEMKAFGTFEKGVFTRQGDLAPGQRRNQDSYEAIWEYVNKRKLDYPRPRYEEPIRMKPAGFDWVPAGQAGVSSKLLGTFSERGCTMSMFKLEPGAKARIAPYGASQIGFVVDGEAVAGGEALRKYTAFSLTQGEACELESAAGMELLLVCLPIISSIDRAAA
jgi:quercetin dioxygenase-like cupin family protein